MRLYYSDHYIVPLHESHRFPIGKYALLRKRILEEGLVSPACLVVPDAASDAEILRTHTPEYLDKVKTGTLSEKEVRRIGLPWSPGLVERSRRSVGGSLAACRSALELGLAANLAGGTHHAYPDHGQGFCVFNDAAIAARAMQAEGRARQVLILDCDVHQGNGTAAIFANDPTVFTFSIHGSKNFPFHKETSDLDIALDDGTGDDEFLTALEDGLNQLDRNFQADLVIYLAGSDPFHDDRLGRLALTKSGLADRDRLVFDYSQDNRLPTAIVMAGGYARDVHDTVDIHYKTLEIAMQRYRRGWL
jgi:acetoin utilization deacetylase AcuC-like enzyme